MNYRKLYEKICGIKIPKNFEIHHIDFDRKNNDINNLVMLPKELHNKYHKALEKYNNINYSLNTKLSGSLEPGYAINWYIKTHDLKIIEEFIDIYYECQKYINYRDYLLGIIPNIYK